MSETQPVGHELGGTCPNCGAPLEADAVFCVVCGKPAAGSDVSQTGNCPNCGWPIDPNTIYCLACGTLVVGNGSNTGRFDNSIQTIYAPPPIPPKPILPASIPPAPIPDMPIALVPAPRTIEDDDPTVRHYLVALTHEEARTGCTKTIKVNRSTHETVEVLIPAGVDVNTKLDAQEYGYYDETTGKRGPLRLSFFII